MTTRGGGGVPGGAGAGVVAVALGDGVPEAVGEWVGVPVGWRGVAVAVVVALAGGGVPEGRLGVGDDTGVAVARTALVAVAGGVGDAVGVGVCVAVPVGASAVPVEDAVAVALAPRRSATVPTARLS